MLLACIGLFYQHCEAPPYPAEKRFPFGRRTKDVLEQRKESRGVHVESLQKRGRRAARVGCLSWCSVVDVGSKSCVYTIRAFI
jgi:hypothetical protein